MRSRPMRAKNYLEATVYDLSMSQLPYFHISMQNRGKGIAQWQHLPSKPCPGVQTPVPKGGEGGETMRGNDVYHTGFG